MWEGNEMSAESGFTALKVWNKLKDGGEVMRCVSGWFSEAPGYYDEVHKPYRCIKTGVHGVMFLCALSEYDQKLFEENEVNRMVSKFVLSKYDCSMQFNIPLLLTGHLLLNYCIYYQTESLDLFEQIVNEQAFSQSAMILFLNKSDLYDEKVSWWNARWLIS